MEEAAEAGGRERGPWQLAVRDGSQVDGRCGCRSHKKLQFADKDAARLSEWALHLSGQEKHRRRIYMYRSEARG